jgi:tRNA modification GTPase
LRPIINFGQLTNMLRPHDEQAIAALASGSGPGAVGVIRVSGHNACQLVSSCFLNSDSTLKPRQASLRQLIDPRTREILDEVVVVFFKGPKSFTGQDTVEIFCHGGPYIIQRILQVVYALGVRPAQPGEFTKRALLNGKLDITTAEGLKELIECQSRQQWMAGRQLYQGKLRDEIESLRREVIGALAYLEAMIDFPDEGDTQHVQLAHVKQRVDSVLKLIENLSSTFTSGKVASRGLMVALVGAPNAGKSTLLNNFLGKQRAIVSERAGTTRDYLEESCLLDGRLIRLVDTAGIRETDDVIEQDGVALSKYILSEADLVVLLQAADSDPNELSAINAVVASANKSVISVISKSDLGIPAWAKGRLPISCKTGFGLDDLKNTLIQIVDKATGSIEERPFITSSRQAAALEAAEESLKKFKLAAQSSAGHEMLAFELLEAARSLASIVGDISNDDVLDSIFKEFCIGK